jgi:hypothetical protein
MSFFELPPPPEPEEQQRQPAWLGPPENEAGVVVPLNVSLARADEVAVFLLSATAFSTGIELAGTVRTREQLEALHEGSSCIAGAAPPSSSRSCSASASSSPTGVRRRTSGTRSSARSRTRIQASRY